jgi:hypothetical protein
LDNSSVENKYWIFSRLTIDVLGRCVILGVMDRSTKLGGGS